jgi:6-phosphofructokinase 1
LLDARLSLGARDRRYPRYAVVVVAEGATAVDEEPVTIDKERDAFGHVHLGGIGELLSKRIRDNTPYESRAVIPGHAQRGGMPSAVDRLMGRLYGAAAVQAVMDGRFDTMVSARGVAPACEISLVNLSDAVGQLKIVDVGRYYDAQNYTAKL